MRIGFTCGVFDLYHPGHVMMLRECKKHCDFLIVAINKADNLSMEINPGKRKPIYSIEERHILMDSCKYVDKVLIYNSESELLEFLEKHKIHIRFLGDDYKNCKITGAELKIPIHYINRDHGLSTTFYLKKIRY
jgi:glycerol-3-phosphate cytidylyltransferase